VDAEPDPRRAFLSVITLGEIRRGIELHRIKDAAAARVLERWLRGLQTHHADRILPITAEIADRWGRLSLNQLLSFSDRLIATTALVHQHTVVTRKLTNFIRLGVNPLNPF